MSTLPHVVIVGAGFAGLEVAKSLARALVRVTVIDRHNHYLFQPLLYQVATAGLSPADIAQPIRSILRRQSNTEVLMAEVTGVDLAKKYVLMNGRPPLSYDTLVIATGSRTSYFGHDDWKTHTLSLKTLEDATAIRRHILSAFEKAELETVPEKQKKLLTFVMIGGGPTGVEMAGAIAELAHGGLNLNFRHIDPKQARIILIEAAPRILSSFPENLSSKALAALEKMHVDVRLMAKVENITDGCVVVGGQLLHAHTIIWTAGVQTPHVAKWLGVSPDRAGRVTVEPDLTLPQHPEVFVLGDAASVTQDGQLLPGVAPVAMQEGRFVGHLIRERAHNPSQTKTRKFRYINKGNLATIGRASAVADFGKVRVSGFLAWFLWIFIHIWYLNGFRNRVLVMIQWAWAYFTFQRGARLITEPQTFTERRPPPSPAES